MDILGWDTVFATTIEEANKQLTAGQASLVSSFDFELSGAQLTGTFAPWQIVVGGGGKLIHLEVPIKSGTMSLAGKSTDLSGVSVIIEVQLELLPDKAKPTESQHLQFNFKSVGATVGDATPGIVTVVKMIDSKKVLSDTEKTIVPPAIAQCLVDNVAAISYIFATVSLIKPDAKSWLTPVHSDYAYFQTIDTKKSVLAILSVTTDRDISALQRNIDPAFLAAPGPAYFAISGDLFLQNVVQPSLPAGIGDGAPATTFRFDPPTHQILNTAAFGIGGVKSGAITYHPKISSLSIVIANDKIQYSASGNCDLKAGIDMSFGAVAKNGVAFDAATKKITITADPNPSSTHDVDVPWYDYVAVGIAAFAAPVAAAIAAVVLNRVQASLGKSIDKSSDVNLSANPAESIQWAGEKTFSITQASLINSFYMSGSLS